MHTCDDDTQCSPQALSAEWHPMPSTLDVSTQFDQVLDVVTNSAQTTPTHSTLINFTRTPGENPDKGLQSVLRCLLRQEIRFPVGFAQSLGVVVASIVVIAILTSWPATQPTSICC